jgi:type VII secretion-associated protein (TIGR03931 family)
VGIPRIRERREVAVAVAAAVGRGTYAVVDAPDGVRDAVPLGEVIVELVRCGGGVATLVDGDRVLCGAQTLRSRLSPQSAPDAVVTVRAGRRPGRAVLAGVLGVLAVVSTGLAVGPHRDAAQPLPVVPMTLLVEGRIGVTVPAQWRVERVTEGPGSARVQVISPADTHVGLHLTQSPLPSRQSLATVAQTLREAFDVQPSGVFVDFNPADQLAGKPVVTYREVRADHHIRWAVLIDDMVRIGVGCQSAPAHDDLVRDACDTAIRSAHAVF